MNCYKISDFVVKCSKNIVRINLPIKYLRKKVIFVKLMESIILDNSDRSLKNHWGALDEDIEQEIHTFNYIKIEQVININKLEQFL